MSEVYQPAYTAAAGNLKAKNPFFFTNDTRDEFLSAFTKSCATSQRANDTVPQLAWLEFNASLMTYLKQHV